MKIKKIRELSKNKKVCLVLSVITIIYTFFSSIFIFTIYSSINQTLVSLAIPNGYYSWDFSTPDPRFEISIGMENGGLFEIAEFIIDLTLDLEYYDLYYNQSFKEQFFQKREEIGYINPLSTFNYTIVGNSSFFNIGILESFWNNISNYTNIFYLMNVTISLKFLNGFVPCKISHKNLNLLMLGRPNCNSNFKLK